MHRTHRSSSKGASGAAAGWAHALTEIAADANEPLQQYFDACVREFLALWVNANT